MLTAYGTPKENKVSWGPKVGRLMTLCLQVRQLNDYFALLYVRQSDVYFAQLHVRQSDLH